MIIVGCFMSFNQEILKKAESYEACGAGTRSNITINDLKFVAEAVVQNFPSVKVESDQNLLVIVIKDHRRLIFKTLIRPVKSNTEYILHHAKR